MFERNSITLLPMLRRDPPRFAAALFKDCKEPLKEILLINRFSYNFIYIQIYNLFGKYI